MPSRSITALDSVSPPAITVIFKLHQVKVETVFGCGQFGID